MSSCQGRGGQVCETGSLSVIFRCHDAVGSRLPVRVTWLLLRRITIMYWCLTPCTSLRVALIHLSFPTLVSASTLGNDSGFMYWNMPVFCKASNYFIPSDLNSDLQCKYYLFTKHFKIFYLYTYVIPYWGNFIFGQMGIWGLSCDGNETYFFVSLFISPIHIRIAHPAKLQYILELNVPYQHILTKKIFKTIFLIRKI